MVVDIEALLAEPKHRLNQLPYPPPCGSINGDDTVIGTFRNLFMHHHAFDEGENALRDAILQIHLRIHSEGTKPKGETTA
jgi:hypothetical protein